jgi:hypothetical protein
MNLHAPVDYERLPEFWQLCDSLRHRLALSPAREATPQPIKQAATFIWWQLFITLGYSARRTNRPGWLSAADERRLAECVEPMFGDNCPVVSVLSDGDTPLLVRVDDGHDCALFRELNQHLAGDHVPKEVRGNNRSQFQRSLKGIAQAAAHQALLLPPEIFTDRAGAPLEQREVDRCMNLILRIDRALLLPGAAPRQRPKGEYTAGFIADAVEVVRRKIPDDEMTQWFYWLIDKREAPALPRSAEELLAAFDKYFPPPKDL